MTILAALIAYSLTGTLVMMLGLVFGRPAVQSLSLAALSGIIVASAVFL